MVLKPGHCWRKTHAGCRHSTWHVKDVFLVLGGMTSSPTADSTNLPSIISTIAARRHSFFGHIRRLLANTPAHKALKLAVDSRSGDIPHHDWNRPAGRPRTTWVRLCGTPDSLLPTHGLLPTTGQRGGRYDPQPVKRSSEWVSEGAHA